MVEKASHINASLIKDLKSCFTSFTPKRFQERWENRNKSSFQKIYICNLNIEKSSNIDLASRVSYYLSSLFFTATLEMKNAGEGNTLSKKELIIPNLSSEPKPITMKFTREGPREFVEYSYDEILQENIIEACTNI